MLSYRSTAGALLLLAAFACGVSPALSQMSPNWDIKAREKASANNSRATSFLKSGEPGKALPLLRRAADQDPTNPQPYLTLAQLLATQGSYEAALDAIRKSYALRPTRQALLTVGIIYYLQRDFDAAVSAWERILDASPQSSQTYADIGMARIRKGDIERASDSFKQAVHNSPNSSLGYYGLALSNYFAGDFVAAREEAQRAEGIDQYPPVVLLLSQLDCLEGNVKQGTGHVGQFYHLQRQHIPSRSMVELGFHSSEDFNWDPFLADNFDDGYLVLSREEQKLLRKQDLNRQGHLTAALDNAQTALANTEVVEQDSLQAITAISGKTPVLATGISHALHSDLYVTHEMGLLKLSEGDYYSAAEYFRSVIQQSDQCNVDRLYLAKALAAEGKSAEASEMVAEFRDRKPKQAIASVFAEIAKVDPALDCHIHTQTPASQTLHETPVSNHDGIRESDF
jgi:tetratricopeptide (TPR) repeat protein